MKDAEMMVNVRKTAGFGFPFFPQGATSPPSLVPLPSPAWSPGRLLQLPLHNRRPARMDPTLDSQYFALLSLAEGFRTNDPPDMSSCMQCLIAILNLLPASSKYVAKTNLQLGKIILNHTADKQHTDYARPQEEIDESTGQAAGWCTPGQRR